MGTSFEAEEYYSEYKQLYKEKEELDKEINRLKEEKNKIERAIEAHIVKVRKLVSKEFIKEVEKKYEEDTLAQIQKAINEGNLETAVKILGELESYIRSKIGIQKPPPAPPVISSPVIPKKAEVPEGKIKERRTYEEGHLKEICRYEYTDDKILRLLFVNLKGESIKSHEYIYDNNGNLVQEIRLDRVGKITTLISYELEGDKIKREILKDSAEDILHTCDLEYDKEGRLKSKIWKDPKGKVIKFWEYRYEKGQNNPNLIIWKNAEGKPYGSQKLKYDKRNNLIEEIEKDRNGNVISHKKYEYSFE